MKNLQKLKLNQLSRIELKSIKGGDACSDRAQQCIIGLPCLVSSYGAFATCIGTSIIGCSPLREFGILCPNPGV